LPLALALLAGGAWAQEPRTVETYVPAKPITRQNPRYPVREFREGREGWVIVSFVVSSTGDVTEAMVEESSGNAAFEKAALDTVLRWRYEPATLNGEPVEQAMTQSKLQFGSGGDAYARPFFRRRYNEIAALIDAGDHTAAAAQIEDLEDSGRFNLNEDAWFWFLKFHYLDAVRSPDIDERVRALTRAVGTGYVYLDSDLHVHAVQALYAFYGRSAIALYEGLRDSKALRPARNYEETLAAMQPSYERMLAAITAENLLVMQGEVGENEYWVHRLVRRSFALDAVAGRLDVIDIRCQRGTKRYTFASDDEVWAVPDAWGDCGVYLKGEPGTTFTFKEYPLSYTAGLPVVEVPRSSDTP
jgi:TonB family protein